VSEPARTPSDGRFAPSPSGPLHLGNLRTALLAWLFARSAGARFVLRIEDLDAQRSRPEWEQAQLLELSRLGLDWDGEVVRQSTRLARHQRARAVLLDQGRVYACWCSRADLRDAARAPHGDGEAPYPGTCRELSIREKGMRLMSDAPFALRLDARGERVAVRDRLRGEVAAEVDDFVVWRADDTPAYHLAVVVDDADQGVGEVVRGDDLLDSAPRQALLARLLGLSAPTYAHVPLVLGPTGARLAKRDGAVTLEERLARGERVEDLVGWMAASTGLTDTAAPLRTGELLERFDPARLAREPTRWVPWGGPGVG
jgi:glutamyl-tRNA synthetase